MFQQVNLEKVKKYWNDRPCNIRHSNKPVGTMDYFEEVQNKRYFVEPHILEFADFEHCNGKKVLEIGCGIGTDTILFLKNGAKVTAIDLSKESLKITKSRVALYGYDANVIFANVEKLSEYLDIQKFDIIYSFGVLHHTPNPLDAFKEILRFMDEKTEFRFMVYHKGAFKVFQILEQYDYDYKNVDTLIAKHSEAQEGCPVTYSYTPDDLSRILDSLGLEIVEIKIDHIFPYRIEEYRNNIYVREDIWQMPAETFDLFQKKYGWHLMVKAKLKN